jgi:Methyltransferase domain
MRNTRHRGGVRNALGSHSGPAGLRNALRVRLRDHRGGPSEGQASSNGWGQASIGGGPAIITAISSEEAAELAQLSRGSSVLEVGSAHGYSATVMALAGARVTSLDPHSGDTWLGDTLKAMQANLAAYGVTDKVEIVQQLSFTAMPRLTREGRRFGLVFIDGDHLYDAVRVDVANALELLEPGGTIACHDYGEDHWCPDVRRALDDMFPAGPSRLTGTLFMVTP